MIRPITESDVPDVLALIRELAAYEHLTDQCIATERKLRNHLFGPNPAAEALVAIEDNKIVGYALWFRTFSTFLAAPGIFLEDIYVQPDYRRRGIGKSVLHYLAGLTVSRGYGRLEWNVLDWNTPSINFYKSLGAEPLADWTMFRLTGTALETVAKKSP